VTYDNTNYKGFVNQDGDLIIAGIHSPDPTIGDPDGWTMTGTSLYGGSWIANANGGVTVAQVAKGMNFDFTVHGSNVVWVDVNDADTIYLSGTTTLAQGDSIVSDGTAGAACVWRWLTTGVWDVMCDSHWSDND